MVEGRDEVIVEVSWGYKGVPHTRTAGYHFFLQFPTQSDAHDELN